MNFENIEHIDLKLSLLSGSTLTVGNLKITPYTLREVKDFGFVRYRNYISSISATVDDFIDAVVDEEKKSYLEEQKSSLKSFDFYIRLGGQELQDKLLMSLGMIFRTDDVVVIGDMVALNFTKMGIILESEDGEMVIDKNAIESIDEKNLTIVNRNNFDNIVEVVKLQNYLSMPHKKAEEKSANPADEETRKLMEDMERNRARVEEKKKAQKQNDGNEDEIDISDIVSAVSSKSNSINKINIWDFTLYQIYDEYSRLELIDSYDYSIKAIMAGAKDINLTHWSSKI